jgi:sugar (pentulose or hexulose) kinase
MPEALSQASLFAANMEGVAYIERFAYEKISILSGEKIGQVFSAGGGSNSDTWLLIRSSVLGVPVCKMQNVSGAAGAAALAASKTHFSSIIEAAYSMILPEKKIEPNARMRTLYDDNYHRFIDILKNKKYIV